MQTIICCGVELECIGMTSTCTVCSTDYNSAGQQLAPRAQWGEETGESIGDILAIDSMTTDQLLEDEEY